MSFESDEVFGGNKPSLLKSPLYKMIHTLRTPSIAPSLSVRQLSYRATSLARAEVPSSAPAKDARMPTPMSLGYNMKYHAVDRQPNNNTPRPLVVVSGWMGAKERQMKPYLNFYHQRNMDTISFAVGPNHVLFPEKAMEQMVAVLNCIAAAHHNNDDGSPNPDAVAAASGGGNSTTLRINKPSAVMFHHFSVGGFLYGQALVAMKKNPHLNGFPSLIKGQVFDSPPDYSSIPVGISKSMGIGGFPEKIIEHCARGYLKLTENTAGVMHRESSAAFHNNTVSAPSLWFYSKADPVCLWTDLHAVTDKWIAKGTPVEHCMWEHTPHIQHGRVDPDRYFGTLDKFIKRNNIV
jgi:hypothetical protein